MSTKMHPTNSGKGAPDGAVLANLTTAITLSTTLAASTLSHQSLSPVLYPMAMYLVVNVVVTFFWRRTPENAVKNAVGIWMTLTQWLYLVVAVLTLAIGDIGGLPIERTVTVLGLLGAVTVALSFCIVWVASQQGLGQFKSIAATAAAMVLAVIAGVGPLAKREIKAAMRGGHDNHVSDNNNHHEAEEPSHNQTAAPKEEHHGAPSHVTAEEPLPSHAAPHHVQADEPHGEHGDVKTVSETKSHGEEPAHGEHAAPLPEKIAKASPHWSYEGATGVENWGKISSEFSTCAKGMEQSPVEIPRNSIVLGKHVLPFILPSALHVIDNGHTLQINYDNGSKVVINGKSFETKQMHFHSPSEHELNGVSYPLELHIVNKSAQGKLAVLGLLVEKGRPNAELAKWLEHMPTSIGAEKTFDDTMINLAKLLPKNRGVYHYPGSLTTPPCSEGVNWNVFAQPIEASHEQIVALQQKYFHNNRPIQPLYNRRIGKDENPPIIDRAH